VPGDPAHHRTLRGPATPECLDRVHLLLADLLAEVADVADADRIGFETALGELVANVVEHATAHGPVRLAVELTGGPDRLTADSTTTDRRPPSTSPRPPCPTRSPSAGADWHSRAPRWTTSPTRSRAGPTTGPSRAADGPERGASGRCGGLVPRTTLTP